MNVVHLATSLNGGAGIAMLRTSNALSLQGVNSTILTRDGIYYSNGIGFVPAPLSFQMRVKSSAVTLLQSKLLQNSSDLVTPISIETMNFDSKVLKEADVLHIHASYNFLNHISLRKLEKFGKPIFSTLHDQRFFTGGCHYSRDCSNYKSKCNKCPQVSLFARRLVYESFQFQNESIKSITNIHLITPSKWLSTMATAATITKGLPIHVVRNAIPNMYFENSLETRELPRQRVRIGFISDQLQNPYKGIDTLANAVNSIASHYGDRIAIVFIGKGKIPIIKAEIPVEHTSSKNDLEMIQQLKKIDLLVVPSNQDNSPSVIGEALAMGVTVIGSDTGGIPEILSSFGMPIFPVDDSEYLARIIIEQIKLRDNRLDIRNRAIGIFSERSHAENIISLYLKA
jgi:glycosyltransferase involved in cell wall biosynthesis